MIIQENQLRPPSPKEMAERHVPLERLRLSWELTCWDWDWHTIEISVDQHYKTDDTCDCPETCGTADTLDAGFTTLELIEFHKDWQIPYEAFVVGDGYDGELALDWTHLVQCKVCQQWYGKGTDHANDTLHTAVEAGTARKETGDD